MDRQFAEKITTEYLKPIFGFALKRCKNIQDAEDLSQEIVLRAFRALLLREDIVDAEKFIWIIAHNALSNYYRDNVRNMVGISIDEIADTLVDLTVEPEEEKVDAVHRLQGEIAYLSKLQRRIVIAYYFENRRQADIAEELGIPLGTVKWHLFEAKKELKRGMDTMRNTSELKFNPIQFKSYGISGASGTKSLEEFFRATLPQNICYSVRRDYKTINEIADDLGVSPVYVESEVEFLEEYGFLLKQKDKYIANFIMEEPTEEFLTLMSQTYAAAAKLFANDLYDTLMASGLLDDPSILCSQTDGPVTLTEEIIPERNFILWSLIPYITAFSGRKLQKEKSNITFDEVATYRPDGSHNIFRATVYNPDLKGAKDVLSLGDWSGPSWNGWDGNIFWQIQCQWTNREMIQGYQYEANARRILSLYQREQQELLSRDEYTWLAEQGLIKTCGEYDGIFKSAWQIVILRDQKVQEKLLEIGQQVKARHLDAFDELKKPYAKATLEAVPPHLRKVKEFELQYMFHDDARFLLHCMLELLESGKLTELPQGQRKAACTLIANA